MKDETEEVYMPEASGLIHNPITSLNTSSSQCTEAKTNHYIIFPFRAVNTKSTLS